VTGNRQWQHLFGDLQLWRGAFELELLTLPRLGFGITGGTLRA